MLLRALEEAAPFSGTELYTSYGVGPGSPEGFYRHLGFDPTGGLLFCCNQRGDNVTVFRVDRKAGTLDFTGHYAPVGNPSCIVFLAPGKGE